MGGPPKGRGLSFPFEFHNDAGPTDNPLAGSRATKTAKLKAGSDKYDPQHTFQMNQFAGFQIRMPRMDQLVADLSAGIMELTAVGRNHGG